MVTPTAFYQLFLDAELNHSSGYFDRPGMTLDQAQLLKNEAILSRCDLRPSMTLLDIGSGWGAAARLAADRGVRVIGITDDPVQHAYVIDRRRHDRSPARLEFRLQRWEEFTEPVDRMICVNAFENFTNKAAFLPHCRALLPRGGRLIMVTVTADRPVFRVIAKADIVAAAERAGFDVHVSESLAVHYVRTLELFIANLDRQRREALRLVPAEQFDTTLRFYATAADLLRRGMNDMFEFTFTAT